MLGVLVITNSTCKDKRNSGNHDITCENRIILLRVLKNTAFVLSVAFPLNRILRKILGNFL